MKTLAARFVETARCATLAALLGVGFAAPCQAGPADDIATILDSEAGTNKRTQAVDRIWAAAGTGALSRPEAREAMKQLLWKGSAPGPLRVHALAKLLSDDSADGQADNRKLLRLRLPTEAQWPVIDAICKEIEARAADPAWRELAPALVRSYARKVPVPPDPDRPERAALRALFPDRSVERTVFEVYLHPDGGADAAAVAGQTPEIIDKQRQAAWDLLGRLDSDGAQRREFLTQAPPDEPSLRPLTRAAAELHVVPITGSELAWVTGLMDSADPGASAWWNQAAGAVQRLSPEQSSGLQLRHIEPVRWASVRKPEWFAADRSALLAELSSRLEPRRKWRKSEGLGWGEMQSRELLSDWRDRLAWGDVLAILVIDEAIRDGRVIASLFKQAEADRADTATEYGGAMFATDAVPMAAGPSPKAKWDVDQSQPGFIVHGYSARPAQRVNDRTFVAPEEMFSAEGAGGRALAHYHFHAQTTNNAEYAGPGPGDHDYAAMHGRSCVVFTTVRPGVMNADYYHRGGVQIDLGEVARP